MFYLTAEKNKYDQKAFSLPTGEEWAGKRFPADKQYYVVVKENGGTDYFIIAEGLSEWKARMWCKFINRERQ